MQFTILFVSLVASAAAISVPKPDNVARALYPRQSNGVCTDNTCPAFDLNGVALVTPTTTGNTLSCDYGVEVCQYDNTSGAAIAGNDPACPANSLAGGCARRRMYKREDNFTALKRKVEVAREEMRARRAAPENMAARSEMGKKKVAGSA